MGAAPGRPGMPEVGAGAGDDVALDAAGEGVAYGADVVGGGQGEAVGPARGAGLGQQGEPGAVGQVDVGDADVARVADAGTGLRDGRRLDDVAHSEGPQVAGDGGADAGVGHDDHGRRLVRAVGDQACGLLEENGHQASWECGTGRLGMKPGRTVPSRSLTLRHNPSAFRE